MRTKFDISVFIILFDSINLKNYDIFYSYVNFSIFYARLVPSLFATYNIIKNLIFDLQALTCFTRLYLNTINMLADTWKSLKIPKGQP